MRDIKFRGWTGCKRVDNFCVGTNLFGVSATVCDVYDKWSHIELDCIEQFTGLLDSNGVEIYEGDVLAIENKSFRDDYNVYYVEYNAGVGAFACVGGDDISNMLDVVDHHDKAGKYIVIGNIHQNPELLK
jgi:uncharacterized phage protein (TIGR01671 family)